MILLPAHFSFYFDDFTSSISIQAMRFHSSFFFAALASALVSTTDGGSVAFTSYFEDDCCSGTPHFIYEEDSDNCQATACTSLTIGDVVYYNKVDCYTDKREDTAAIFAGKDAPYVLLEQYSPPTGCENFVDALAFYADGVCRPLPDISPYSSAIAAVNEDLSLELQLYDDTACTEVASNVSIASTDVEWTCFVGYSDSYGLVYYTTDTDTTEC
ncbi:hypothetical protein V7S43_010049 [Phytophthora oleae]|uniref:Uncharacterized protein n=1 Tax=Phytophthora oleae TaxID=2107226 RepID=A0ABD3FGR9_9STRA